MNRADRRAKGIPDNVYKALVNDLQKQRTMNRHEIHKQVIEHFGVVDQLKKTVEEIEELLAEICSSSVDTTNIILELADVKNMSEQLPTLIDEIIKNFGFNRDEVESKQDFKMNRTKFFIEKNNN